MDEDEYFGNFASSIRFNEYVKKKNSEMLQKRYADLEENNKSEMNRYRCTATPKLQAFIAETSRLTQIPQNVVLCAALSQLALASQGAYRLQLEAYRSPIPLSLWFLVEMASGEGKSPIADFLERLVKPVVDEAQSRNEQARVTYAGKFGVWSNIKTGLESALRKATKKGESAEDISRRLEQHMAEEPKRPREFVRNLSDITKSGLCVTASNSLPSIGIHSPEGGVTLNCVDDNFMYVANSFWRGEEYDYRRVNQVSTKLKDVFLSILIYAQPGVIAQFLDKKGNIAWDCGFLARFMVCRSTGKLGVVPESGVDLTSESAGNQGDYFQNVVRRMFSDQFKEDWTGLEAFKLMELGEGARLRFDDFKHFVSAEQKDGRRFERIQVFCSKLPEMVGRIAALMHLYEAGLEDDRIISLETMEVAIDVGLYFAESYSNFFKERFGLSEEENDEILLWKWLCKMTFKEGMTEISIRGILHRGPNDLRTMARRDRALYKFLDKKWLLKRKTLDGNVEVVVMTEKGKQHMEA